VDLVKKGSGPSVTAAGRERPGDETVAEDGAGVGRRRRGGKRVDYAARKGDEEGVGDEQSVPAGLVLGLHAGCSQHFEPELLLGFGLGQVASGEPVVNVAKAVVERLKDVERVRGYPGFADRIDVEDGQKVAEHLLGIERPESVQAVLCDGAGGVVVMPDMPDAPIGENARPSLIGVVIEGKTVFLVFEFAEEVSLELLKGRFVVVAGLGAMGVRGEAVGLGFDENAPARKIQVGVAAGSFVGDAVVNLKGVEKPADVLADVVFVAAARGIEEALRS